MKLTGYEILHCDAGWRVFSFLKLTTDEGLHGISEYNESYGSPRLSGVIENLAQRLMGRDPCAHELLSQQLYAITRQASGGMAQTGDCRHRERPAGYQGQGIGGAGLRLARRRGAGPPAAVLVHCGTYRISADSANIMGKPKLERLEDLVALGREVRDEGFQR